MEALNHLAYVVFAVLFVSLALAMYVNWNRGSVEEEFRLKAEELSERIRALGSQSPGTVVYFEIFVPDNCELGFAGGGMVVKVGSWSQTFPTGLRVSGPTVAGRHANLRLERTPEGVEVSAR